MALASKLPFNAHLVWMPPIVRWHVGDVNPLFAQGACKDACRSVNREHHLGISNPRAKLFDRLKLKEAMLGFADGEHRRIEPMGNVKHFKRVDRSGLRIPGREGKQTVAQNRRRDDGRRIKNDLAVNVLAFGNKAVNEIHPIQARSGKIIESVRPDLKVEDAVVLAMLVFGCNRAAIRNEFKQIVVFW